MEESTINIGVGTIVALSGLMFTILLALGKSIHVIYVNKSAISDNKIRVKELSESTGLGNLEENTKFQLVQKYIVNIEKDIIKLQTSIPFLQTSVENVKENLSINNDNSQKKELELKLLIKEVETLKIDSKITKNELKETADGIIGISQGVLVMKENISAKISTVDNKVSSFKELMDDKMSEIKKLVDKITDK